MADGDTRNARAYIVREKTTDGTPTVVATWTVPNDSVVAVRFDVAGVGGVSGGSPADSGLIWSGTYVFVVNESGVDTPVLKHAGDPTIAADGTGWAIDVEYNAVTVTGETDADIVWVGRVEVDIIEADISGLTG